MDDRGHKYTPKIFVLCDRSEMVSYWEYILPQQGLIAILEVSSENAIDRWSAEIPELIVIDIDKQDPLEICKKFRSNSLSPILLFLPTYNETQIVAAYTAGVDDVIIKPISHTIIIHRILAWVRRSWIMPTDGLNLVKTGKYRLVPRQRSLIGPNDVEINLTNLEYRLLHLLMSHPGRVFMTEAIVEAIWGGYANGDHVLLKNVVYRLRKKIEVVPSNPVVIKTLHGGYSFGE